MMWPQNLFVIHSKVLGTCDIDGDFISFIMEFRQEISKIVFPFQELVQIYIYKIKFRLPIEHFVVLFKGCLQPYNLETCCR